MPEFKSQKHLILEVDIKILFLLIYKKQNKWLHFIDTDKKIHIWLDDATKRHQRIQILLLIHDYRKKKKIYKNAEFSSKAEAFHLYISKSRSRIFSSANNFT